MQTVRLPASVAPATNVGLGTGSPGPTKSRWQQIECRAHRRVRANSGENGLCGLSAEAESYVAGAVAWGGPLFGRSQDKRGSDGPSVWPRPHGLNAEQFVCPVLRGTLPRGRSAWTQPRLPDSASSRRGR